MKLNFLIVICILLTLAVPAVCQDTSVGDTRDTASDIPPRTVGCGESENERVYIQAGTIQQEGELIRATGDVRFQKGNNRLTALDAYYSVETGTGKLTRATFTTCSNTGTPDYHLVAREVTLLPNNRILGKGVGLYLGNTRVLGLPYIRMNVGGRGTTRNIFPRPGFDREDGYTLSQDFRMVDKDNLRANADLRFTSRSGVQGQVYSVVGLDGDLIDLPGKYLSYDSVRSSALDMPVRSDDDCPKIPGPDPNAARFRGFGTFTLRQRTYDIENRGLVVYRQPEVGVTYLGNPINTTKTSLDPRLEIYPEITASWGRFRESPGMTVYTGRGTLSASVAANIFSLGPRTAVQPFYSHAWSAYGSGDDYRVSSLGLDASHLWRNGSIISGRYIKRNESGVTPFFFDNVDVQQEFQGALQVQTKKHVAGVAIGYNIDLKRVYDWEVMYGWRTDCLVTSARYNQRLKRLSLDIGLINL